MFGEPVQCQRLVNRCVCILLWLVSMRLNYVHNITMHLLVVYLIWSDPSSIHSNLTVVNQLFCGQSFQWKRLTLPNSFIQIFKILFNTCELWTMIFWGIYSFSLSRRSLETLGINIAHLTHVDVRSTYVFVYRCNLFQRGSIMPQCYTGDLLIAYVGWLMQQPFRCNIVCLW